MDIYRGKDKDEKEKKRVTEGIRIIRDRMTKIPKRVLGIELYPASMKKGDIVLTEKIIEPTFKSFIKENRKLFEIEADDLQLIAAKKIRNRWFVKYQQYYEGIPVYHATVNLESSDRGRVGSYAAKYHPKIRVSTEPKVQLDEAIQTAKRTYKEQDQSRLKTKDDSLIIYPEKKEDTYKYHLAWMFEIVGEEPDPEIEKYFIVDAINGKILHSYTARFPGANVSGTVRGEIYPENPTDAISTMPMQHEYVYVHFAGRTQTNHAGYYSRSVPWYWPLLFLYPKWADFSLDGPYAHVQDNNGNEYTESRQCNTSSPCNLTWTAADRDHINMFYHLNRFHDWLQTELGYAWVNFDGTSCFNARVNYNFWNAYAGDPMQFGNNEFARSSDVIYHECTHNVLHHEYGDYIGWPDAYSEAYAMDEGFADYFACACTNDSQMGEGYSANPRDLDNSRQYVGKENYNSEGHTGGTIIGGACWNLRQRLTNQLGAPGRRVADQLVLEAHQILSSYPRDYYFSDPHESNLLSALYRAADQDNNLMNSFPYFMDIQLAFHAHALLQAVLEDGDSYDFSTNTLGNVTGGDLYYYQGKFWANNYHQKGVKDLGDIGNTDLSTITIPTSGFTQFGVNAVSGHTYVSKAQEGEVGGYIFFRVNDISADKSTVTIQYLYQFDPLWYVANTNSKEIHQLNCFWVSLMSADHKAYYEKLVDVAELIENNGYNGCYYCLPRYDTDTLTLQTVLQNLNEDV